MDKVRAHGKRGAAALAAKPGDVEREKGAPAGNGKMTDSQAPAGILDDAVGAAAGRAAAWLLRIREEELNGMRMVDDPVDRDLRWELDKFVGDLSSHNVYLLKFDFFWLKRE